MTHVGFKGITDPQQDALAWIRENVHLLQKMQQGKINTDGEITLDINAASTTLVDSRISFQTNVILVPTTLTAAQETWFVPEAARKNGSAVIEHTNNVITDRTYHYTLIG